MKIFKKFSFIFMVCLISQTANSDAKAIQVLIVDGFGNHDWQATTTKIKEILTSAGGIEIDIETVPEQKTEQWGKWVPKFSNYDVVIQTCNDINNGKSWPQPAKTALEEYMKQGGGMFIFHSGNNAFPKWKEYNKMIGLGWRNKNFGEAIIIKDDEVQRIPAGEGGNTGHGKRLDIAINRLGDHPIHKGYPKIWMAADLEIYRYARGPAENLTVLSYALDPKTQLNFPVEWTISYGKGRVYNSTFGHYWHDQDDPPGIRCVGFQTTFIRAIQWLAKLEITHPIPDNFPTSANTSLVEKPAATK